ncbi:MAG: hypothetical protein H0W86_00700 [Armatimonadetes bacterium]|nr:hypothetical protein [Armatimonadota bacterium]
MHEGERVLAELLDGNRRFREARSSHSQYSSACLAGLASEQSPIAAVVTCSDSRVAPEILFDQPLGRLFVSRVPGNVASDSAKWMVEIAVGLYNVPLLLVMGHTGCLAVGEVVQGKTTGTGGSLRLRVSSAVMRASRSAPADLWREAVIQNVHQTIEHLSMESQALRPALRADRIVPVPMLYEMETGEVIRL